ncbi:MAG: hypothetical protein AABW46_00285 [Nanoarchaeota archaeon]
MLPIVHLLSSIIPVILLFPIYKYWSFVFLIGSWLIDFDHYIWYFIYKKDFSIKNAYRWCRDTHMKDQLHIFHVIEFWILMFFLSFIHILFGIVFAGMVFHLILDFIDYIYEEVRYKGHKSTRTFTFSTWLRRN